MPRAYLGGVGVVAVAQEPLLEGPHHVLDDGALLPRLLGRRVARAAANRVRVSRGGDMRTI